jgi:alpha-ketoglutarate-dependent taurine dioxygenase
MNFTSFKRVQPRAVALPDGDLIATELLSPQHTLPLIISPVTHELDLLSWAESNLQFIETALRKHGALLFRGFDVNTASDFERFARVVCKDLIAENGEHPRASVSGKVYTPVFYPADKKVLWHNENSFNLSWPLHILFCCSQPALEGGETPVADSRKVFELIDPEVKREFIHKQVMYVRNYSDGLGLSWQTVFQTDSRAAVEDHCRRNGLDFEWKSGDRLRTACVRPALINHPKTGAISWFNQAQHWHVSCLDPTVRDSLLAAFETDDLPRTCLFGDGSTIPDAFMDHILDVYRKLEVTFRWRQKDVLLVDNVLTAHARNPFVGPRKLFVALANSTSY